MKICSSGHESIIYTAESCPVCDLMRTNRTLVEMMEQATGIIEAYKAKDEVLRAEAFNMECELAESQEQ